MEILFFVLFIGFLIYAAFANHRAAQKRSEDLRAFALANNLSFTPDKDTFFASQFPFFSILQEGHSQYAFNILRGTYKTKSVLAFDYHYAVTTRTQHGSQTHHYYFSGVILTTEFPLKPLSIRPENFLDKIGELIGLDDIDFESTEFSKKFFVTAKEKKFAYGVIHQGVMEYLLAHPGYYVELDRNEVFIYKRKTFTPEEFSAAFDFGMDFIKKIPDYLIKELKGTTL